MSVIASDGLGLFIGDGGTPQVFYALRGMAISRLDIVQQVVDSKAVTGTGWLEGVAAGERRLVIECDGVATDEAAALRMRSLAMSGAAGTVRLAVSPSQKVECLAFITRYREVVQPGEIKRVVCQFESSGVASLV